MNRILFEREEVASDGLVTLSDRRADHIRKVLRSQVGDRLRVGILDGEAGTAVVESLDVGQVRLRATLGEVAPRPWFDLLLAVPRPKVLHRLWAEIAAIGVGRVILINACRVERCYFDTHWLTPESWRPLLVEGLQQAGATQVPEVLVRRAFKPFVQDELPVLYKNAPKWVAHPRLPGGGRLLAPVSDSSPARPLLAVGPEGGWVDFELGLLKDAGFLPISLGDRALRTDTAIVALAGALRGVYLSPSLPTPLG